MENLTVIGAGVLGGQIAWHGAYSGKTVVVYDIAEEGLNNCRKAHASYAEIYPREVGASAEGIAKTRDRLSYSTDLTAAVANADVVIEAVPEIPKVKIETYQRLAGVLPEKTILATNSSTLLPSQFADATGRPDRYCALHFANLIWSLNIAEVMAHPGTSPETVAEITRFAIEIGMVPVPIGKEQNGYVLNSLLVPLLNAAQSLVVNGVADPETVDRTYMILNRGCERGPFGLIDIVGIQTAYNIGHYWGNENGDEQMLANARYLKERFLDKGLLGLQTGQGFYNYPNPRYAEPDFLDVPDVSRTDEFARLALPRK